MSEDPYPRSRDYREYYSRTPLYAARIFNIRSRQLGRMIVAAWIKAGLLPRRRRHNAS